MTAMRVSMCFVWNDHDAHLASCSAGDSLVGRSCTVGGSPLIGSTAAAAQAHILEANSLSSDAHLNQPPNACWSKATTKAHGAKPSGRCAGLHWSSREYGGSTYARRERHRHPQWEWRRWASQTSRTATRPSSWSSSRHGGWCECRGRRGCTSAGQCTRPCPRTRSC
jgi:hypothetical protein